MKVILSDVLPKAEVKSAVDLDQSFVCREEEKSPPFLAGPVSNLPALSPGRQSLRG